MMHSFVVTIVISLGAAGTMPMAMQSDLARELEDAKALYDSANFIRALQALGAVVRVLDDSANVDNRDAMRIDGHLHLGLTYFAQEDRTGTGTLSVFGHQMRFDLRAGFPLVTTKKLHLRSIASCVTPTLNGSC